MARTFIVAALLAAIASTAGCGDSPCADLLRKRPDCVKAGKFQVGCEVDLDAVVKARGAPACKAMLDNLDRTLK